MKAIRDLTNLGPKSEQLLAQIGVHSVDVFLAGDVFEFYARLHHLIPSVSLNMLYAMIGAQEGLPWQQVAQTRKTEILLRLDDMGLAR